MTKKLLLLAILLCLASCAYADVEVWHDDSLKLTDIKKVFVLPVESSLKAGESLMPKNKLNAQLQAWTIDGIASAFKKGKITVKGVDALLEDMKFIYDDVLSGDAFYKRASEMGYKAFVKVSVSQEFRTEHIPERTRTYTEYKEIQKKDSKGRIIETIRIPEEKTEVIPAHDVTYLFTDCEPRLYLTEDWKGDYAGAASGKIYREYQGGPVMKVVENITKASLKALFTQK